MPSSRKSFVDNYSWSQSLALFEMIENENIENQSLYSEDLINLQAQKEVMRAEIIIFSKQGSLHRDEKTRLKKHSPSHT